MMLIDDQAGSSELYKYIRAISPHAILTRITPPFGDVVWTGEGRGGKAVQCAVEYKKLDDVLKCMVDGRFTAHQLPGLLENYQRVYLLIELGRTRVDRNTGILQKARDGRWYDIQRAGRGFTMRDLEHWITTIVEHTGIVVDKTFDEYESARWVIAKYSWWTSKGWEQHDSLKQFHVEQPPYATFVKPSLLRRMAKELDGVRWQKSEAIAKRFRSVRRMACANEREWEEVDGIGRTMADRIVKSIVAETDKPR